MAARSHASSSKDETSALPRLCLITHSRYPIGEPRAERAAKTARDAGFEVRVVCHRGPQEARTEVIDGIEIRRLRMSHQRGIGVFRMIYEYVGFTILASFSVASLHIRHRLKAVQVHSPPDFLVIAGLFPRLTGAKLILDIRDLSPHLWDARFSERQFSRTVYRLLRLVERAACALAHQVVTVHEPYRGELVKHGIKRDKVAIVMNTPDESMIAPIVATLNNPCDDGSFLVVYHGTVTSWYGVDILVRAIAIATDLSPGIRGLVLGEGDALPEVIALAAELGIADKVRFSGKYQPIEETLRTVSVADCGVIPNPPSELNRFILSNKLFEYIVLGVPVVAARLETIAAHFDEDEITYFDPGDPESLAEALVWVAQHRREATKKIEQARDRARSYSSPQGRELYLGLLEAKAS